MRAGESIRHIHRTFHLTGPLGTLNAIAARTPGDIVVLDNLSAHKDKEAIRLMESAGAKAWFLRPYSPDLNPIEKMWSKNKEFLRATKARTFDALLTAIANALKRITAQDVQGWFESCGYATCHS